MGSSVIIENMGKEMKKGDDMQSSSNRGGIPDCFKCCFFSITWDTRFPRACSMFNIKGQNLPSVIVLRNTGQNCPAFTPKDKTEKIDK